MVDLWNLKSLKAALFYVTISPLIIQVVPVDKKTVIYILFPSLLAILVGFLFYSSAGRDDAHITYWAGYTLSEYGKIVNYNGEQVEQSSSLLQVLLLAVTHKLFGGEMIDIGIILSILFAVGTIGAAYRLALKIDPGIAFLSALLTGTSAYFIYWILGGLETTIVSFSSIFLVLTYVNYLEDCKSQSFTSITRLAGPMAATALFLLVRPETPVVLFCILLGAALVLFLKKISNQTDADYYKKILTGLIPLTLIFFILAAFLFAFRMWYFNSPFPQPVTAKAVGLSWPVISEGFLYLKDHLFTDIYIGFLTGFTVICIGFGIFTQVKTTRLNLYMLFSLLFIMAYTSFVVLAGGDWMEGGRFWVHQLPLALMFIPYFIKQVIKSKKWLIIVLCVLFLVQGKTILDFAQKYSTGMPAWSTRDYYEPLAKTYGFSNFSWFERYNRVHIREIPTIYHLNIIIEKLLASKRKRRRISIMSGQIGMVAYYISKKYFKRIRFIDRHGLIDRTLTDCKVTSGSKRYSMGLYYLYDHFFRKLKELKKKCNITKPDIIFDLKARDANLISRNGYTIVYFQKGTTVSGSSWLPGFKLYFNQFIAVRNTLLKALNGLKPVNLKIQDFHKDKP